MAAAETALPSISTLTTLGPFLDTQEDFLKVGPVGSRWAARGSGLRPQSWGIRSEYCLGIQRPGRHWVSSVQARGLNLV